MKPVSSLDLNKVTNLGNATSSQELVNKALGTDNSTKLYDPRNSFNTPYNLSAEENKALDPEYRADNPAAAAINYPGWDSTSISRRHNAGNRQLVESILKPYFLNPSKNLLNATTNFGPWGSAAATGGLGFAAGSLMDFLANKAGMNSHFNLLLGLGGAGLGHYMGKNKSEQTPENTKYSNVNFNMNKQISPFYKLGHSIGFIRNNVNAADVETIMARENTFRDLEKSQYGVLQKVTCKMAACMYALTGQTDKFEFHLFNKLAHAKHWHESLDPYADTVNEVLGKHLKSGEFNINEVIKSAAGIAQLIPNILSGGAQMTPSMLSALMGAAALTGGAGGAVLWHANRHANEDSNKNEQLKQQIGYYKMLNDDISHDLKRKGLIVSDEIGEDDAKLKA